MIRSLVSSPALRKSALPSRTSVSSRSMITSAQKRALNKAQLEGKEVESSTPKTSSATGANKTSPTPVSSEGGSGMGSVVFGLAAIGLVGGGVAMYKPDLLPPVISDLLPTTAKEEVIEETVEKTEPIPVVSESAEPQTEEKEVAEKKVAVPSTNEEPKVNRVSVEAMIEKGGFPEPDYVNRSPQIVPPVKEIPGAHKVSVEIMNNEYPPFSSSEESVEEQPVTEPLPEESKAPDEEEKKETIEPITPTTAIESAKELKATLASDTSSEIKKALDLLHSQNAEEKLHDLDSLSPTELKIRLVRLTMEMGENARLEALRLKELLAIQEKEVSDKYLQILQEQRFQFENLMASKLRELEDKLSRQTSHILQQKDASIQNVLNEAALAQEDEYKKSLESSLNNQKEELTLKLEQEYTSSLKTMKEEYITIFEEQLNKISSLKTKIQQLEDITNASKTYELHSQRAHALSAAALALSSKLESSSKIEDFQMFLSQLKEDPLMESALSSLPSKKLQSEGVPTVGSLQKQFINKVEERCRQAALVPEGHTSLGAQLVGIVYSKFFLTTTALDGASAPGDNTNSALYTLAKAKTQVELGNLEKAVKLLDELEMGENAANNHQVNFTVRDWKQNAKDRVAVDKAVQILKMECALLNGNMGKK